MSVVAPRSFSILLVVALSVMTPTKADDHMNDNWNQLLLFDSNANLTCQDDNFDPKMFPHSKYQWLLPSGSILNATEAARNDHFALENNDANLIIYKIDHDDFGVYFCLVTVGPHHDSVHTVIKLGVNANGAYYGDMWAKYNPKIRTGLIAGGAVFIFMTMLCLNVNQSKRDKSPPPSPLPLLRNDKFPQPLSMDGNSKEMKFDNPAFAGDESEHKDAPTGLDKNGGVVEDDVPTKL